MKVHLLFADREMDFKTPVPRQRAATAQDVELESILAAMAQDDAFVHDLARTVLLSPLEDVAAIRYRQQVLADCARHPEVVREVYEIANSATRAERSEWGSFVRSPELVLDRAIRVLTQFVDHLTQLREIGRRHSAEFESPGFQGFFEELERELNDEFFARVRAQLEELEHRGSLLVSAQLGPGNHGARYVLRTPAATRRRWLARLFRARRGADTIEIAGPDETGHRYLSRLREMGINPVANAVARSADHILAYFDSLRHELGFYLGSLALRTQLVAKGMRTCTPDPSAPEPSELRASGLYDPALALRLGGSVVPNDLSADGRELLIITGANQGGKSTLLRGIGLAFLMMQAGVFVAADHFSASVVSGVFTHFKREEDAGMRRGKLDEELQRLSEVTLSLRTHGLLLLNESFSSTNEREGSEIAREVLRALREFGVRVVFVTFLYDLTRGLSAMHDAQVLFLRAERGPDGQRTFRIVPGEPLTTSYGPDLYRIVFGSPVGSQTGPSERSST